MLTIPLATVSTYLPIVVAPLVALALAAGLQRGLKIARRHRAATAPTATSTTTALVLATPPVPSQPTWAEIVRQSNPLVAYVLPIITSLSLLLLGLWPFAYLGWGVIRLDPDPGWGAQVPPWFGNLGYFLGFGLAGLAIAFTGTLLAIAIGVGLHALGKCILWPEVCRCGEDPQRDERNAGQG